MRLRRIYNHFIVDPGFIWVFFLFVVLHLLLRFYTFPNNSQIVDNYSSPVFQIVGVVIVLVVINSNLGIISRSNIYEITLDWFKRLPQQFKKGIKLDIAGAVSSTSFSKAELTVGPKLETIEDKVKHLFDEVKRLDEKIHETDKRLKTNINSIDKSHKEKYDSIINRLNDLDVKLKKSIVGGAGTEILGVFTAGYGILIPLIFS